MLNFWRGFLWALAVGLVIGVLLAWLDGSTVLAQGEEVELSDDVGASITNDPHIYKKCWTTDSKLGDGFTWAQIWGGGPFATPYTPALSRFEDRRGNSVAPIKNEYRWKRTRADLIDARFYRGTGLVYLDDRGNPGAYAPWDSDVREFADSDEIKQYLGADPDEDESSDGDNTGIGFNPYLNNSERLIEALRVEWQTGSGRAGDNRLDPAKLLEHEQADNAAVAGRTVVRAGPYHGDGQVSAGRLDPHSSVYQGGALGAPNITGYRTSQGTEIGHVVVASGTVSTTGTGGNVSTVVNLETNPQEVTNQTQNIEYNDPVNQEVQYGGVARRQDHPKLHILHSSDWYSYHDTSLGINRIGDFWTYAVTYAGLPSGTQLANGDVRRSCIYLGSRALIPNAPGDSRDLEDRRREHMMLCWLVDESSENIGESETVIVSGGDLFNGSQFNAWRRMSSGVLAPDQPLARATQIDFSLPVWVEASLEEAAPEVRELPAEKRRGLLAPAELNDAPDDAILVSIDLREKYRMDPEADNSFTGRGKTRYRLFGDETVGTRVVKDLRPDTSPLVSVGYKQSYMLPPSWGMFEGGKDRVVPWMYDHTDPLVNNFGMESMVLWPVHLSDMNYYLFRARGFGKEHGGHRGHVLNLAYAGVSDGDSPSVAASVGLGLVGGPWLIANYAANVVKQYHGNMANAVPVPDEVAGTSGRNNVKIYDLQLNPFVPGKVYYPFYDLATQETLVANDYQAYPHSLDPRYREILLYPADLVKAGVVSPADAGQGEGTYGANARFQWRIQEGEPTPGSGAGGDREGAFRRLGFDLNYLGYLNAIDLPSDPFAEVNVGTEASPEMVPAWPNGYIDPNESHVLVLTFYEGRLANEWEFMPKGFEKLGAAGSRIAATPVEWLEAGADVALQVEKTAVGIVGWGTSFLGFEGLAEERQQQLQEEIDRDLLGDLGAIPTFQYRRAICRVVVVPDGVVTPASGWAAVTSGLKDMTIGILKGLAAGIQKLIERLERMPEEIVMGATTMAAEGVCHGAGLMDNVGSGTTSADTSSAGAADVVITGPEHEEREGREKCERVREEGALQQPGGHCDEVAAAVQDRSCSPLPLVNFGHVLTGTILEGPSHDQGWVNVDSPLDNPAHPETYRDVYYYSYPGVANPEGWQPYRNGFSLQDAVNEDRGYGWVWFRLPNTYESLMDNEQLVNKTGALTAGDSVDLERTLARVSGVDYDGFVLYVRPDPRMFRYADCEGIYEPDETTSSSWADTEIKCVSGIERDVDGDGDEEVIPWKVPVVKKTGGGYVSPAVVAPMEETGVMRFVLPRYYVRYQDEGQVFVNAMEGFGLGSVPGHFIDRPSSASSCFYSLVPIFGDVLHGSRDRYRGQYLPDVYHDADLRDTSEEYRCAADSSVLTGDENVAFIGRSDWDRLAGYLDYVWYLGRDSEYSFALASYRGNPSSSTGIDEGEISEWTTVRGGAGIACLESEVYWHATGMLNPGDRTGPESVFSASRFSLRDVVLLDQRFGCSKALDTGGSLEEYGPGTNYAGTMRQSLEDRRDAVAPVSPRLLPRAVERGVLAAQASPLMSGDASTGFIFGSTQCGGFWSGTPDGFSWDSGAVWTLWSICWVFAMVLLFVLLLWDSIALVYGGWTSDGRGVSLSSMIPRYLLALLLVLLSLYLCRVTLSLAGDVTCFFIHATGMTFWGFIWAMLTKTLLMVLHLFGAMFGIIAGTAALVGLATGGVGAVLGSPFMILVFKGMAFVILGILLFVLYYTLKVFGGMLVRIVLLVLLIGLSPVAFAMYASETTAHWTKKWVSLFLGTVFQQLMVLIVLFVGGAMVVSFYGDAVEFWNLWEVLLSLLMVLMTVFLAARIPDIVNPGAKGMFSGFGQALTMAAAAGATLGAGMAGAVGGAAVGSGLGSAGGGIGNMARNAVDSVRNSMGNVLGGRGPGGGPGGGPDTGSSGSGPGWSAGAGPGGALGTGPAGASGSGPGGAAGSGPGGAAGSGPGAAAGSGPGGAAGSGPDGAAGFAPGGAAGRSWSQMSRGERLSGAFSGMGRGFAAGMARGSNFGRALTDLQSGRVWSTDPTTQYSPYSQAQLQSFNRYVRGEEDDPEFMAASERARRQRGYGGGRIGREASIQNEFDPQNLPE